MAYLRKLPSGKWQATVRLPSGARRSRTDPLKSVAAGWAAELEGDRRRGDVIDPRAGEVTIGELWERAKGARRLELASRRRDESHWRCHVAPRWAGTPVGVIMRPDVRAWVVGMERAGVGAWTVRAAAGVLRAVLELAVDARLVRANPARGLRLPIPPAHLDRVLAPEEETELLAALDQAAGGRPHGRLLTELMAGCGLRWEEATALDREHVDRRTATLEIGPVAERDGTIRSYPKSAAGVRTVPVPDHLWPAVRARALAAGPGGLLVTAPAGGVLLYPTWRCRVWVPALAAAGLDDPQPTPHDLRHTYGTRLGEDGVPPHEIMALMGHGSLRAVERYLHAGEGRMARARAAIASVHAGRASRERHERPHQRTPADIRVFETPGHSASSQAVEPTDLP